VVRGRPGATSEADASNGGVTIGFLAGVLALCLAVGGGTFYFAGSEGTLEDLVNGTTGPFISAADGPCKRMWVPNARNTPALVCYLTTNVARLCDHREKKHMAKIMRSYRNDRVALTSQLMMGGVKAVAIARSDESMNNIRTMSESVAKAQNNENYVMTHADQKAFDAHGKMIKKMEKAVMTPGISASFAMTHISDKALAGKIRRLGAAGYMKKGDFGWFPDELVGEAFKDIKTAGNACKS
jgi:hypothetical protein